MDAQTVIANFREAGPIMGLLWATAIYALIAEWIASSRFESACRTCEPCAQRRKQADHARKVARAARTGRCPNDGFALEKGMTCPMCRKSWTDANR